MSARSAPLDSCDVHIVGGGRAGIATAASLLRRRPHLDVCIVEPSETHCYQPGWTMLGAGVFTPERTRRRPETLMTRLAWHLKAQALPEIYWLGMLKGHEWLARPEHVEPAPQPRLAVV